MLGHNRRRMTGAECMADMLAGYGVTHVFMVPAVLRRSFVEMERRTNIARIHTHGEKSAAYMADGYARASGKPGVCMAQVVGAQNLAAGLRDAHLAHSPVIAFTGGRDPLTKYRGSIKRSMTCRPSRPSPSSTPPSTTSGVSPIWCARRFGWRSPGRRDRSTLSSRQ